MSLIGRNAFGLFEDNSKLIDSFFSSFRKFDLDGNGTIDKHELKTALTSFGKWGISSLIY